MQKRFVSQQSSTQNKPSRVPLKQIINLCCVLSALLMFTQDPFKVLVKRLCCLCKSSSGGGGKKITNLMMAA